MQYKVFLPVACAVLVATISTACSLDPWMTGEKYPDIVTITKTTRFGKSVDGSSPMRSRLGEVTFSHKTHEEVGLSCVSCHHKTANPDRIKRCASCHVGDDGYTTMHGLCVDCHIGKKEGPQRCFECH